MSDLDEIESMKTIASALESLQPEEKGRVLHWVNSKYNYTHPDNPAASPVKTNTEKGSGGVKPNSKVSKSSKKSKSIIKIDKTLNLNPSGKISAEDFAKKKTPSNAKLKSLVAAYYVRETLEYEKIAVEQVAAFFKGVGWPLPADLLNVMQQAGTEGWLDTSDNQNILITSSGETVVEHKLPKTGGNSA